MWLKWPGRLRRAHPVHDRRFRPGARRPLHRDRALLEELVKRAEPFQSEGASNVARYSHPRP